MAKVALKNPGAVPPGAIEDVVVSADLPSGHILLIVGDEMMGDDWDGLCIPRRFVPSAANLYGLDAHLLDKSWECGVLIAAKWAQLQPDFPAYFAYLLGHELGHAATALSNLSHVAYESLLVSYIRQVTDNQEWCWDEMPHERRYDQFGLAIAYELFGEEHVREEFDRLCDSEHKTDIDRIRKILELTPLKSLDGILKDLAEFSRPYRKLLLKEWTTAREHGKIPNADGIEDLGALWNAASDQL